MFIFLFVQTKILKPVSGETLESHVVFFKPAAKLFMLLYDDGISQLLHLFFHRLKLSTIKYFLVLFLEVSS